ncbi:MAG TPA: hypothetical protein DCX54_04505, partial [Flavobacteriales bacterium]|nr:hypothetical protein [Flavobacteriales bacterium]
MAEVENEMRDNIFSRDSPPYFHMHADSTDTLGVGGEMVLVWNKTQLNNQKFIEDNSRMIWIHGLLYLLLVLLFFVLKSECSKVDLSGIRTFQFFNHFVRYPYVSALIFGLFLSFWIYQNRPVILNEQLMLLTTIPIVALLSGLYRSVFRLALLTVGVLFFMEQIQYFISGHAVLQRNLMMLESVTGLIISVYLSIPKSGFIPQERTKNWLLVKLFPLIPLLFLFAIYQNIQGSVQFSRMIISVLIKCSTVGVVLYSVVMFVQGFVELVVASEFGKKIHTVRDKSELLMRWSKLILGVWAVYTFFKVLLNQMRLDVSFMLWWNEAMEYGWEFGDASLTIGTLVDFILILIVFTVIANVSRHLLETELLPRFNMKKGVPMAIGVVVRYSILVLGFFMAVAAAGINLDKLGFLAGALGVGIGFGLQNVVNNFVSGLILVFERPIHIDDVITAGETEGIVKEVGIRASKI